MKQKLGKKTEPCLNTKRKYIKFYIVCISKKRQKNIPTLNNSFNSRLHLCLEAEQTVALEIKSKILHRKIDQQTTRNDTIFKQSRKITFYANTCFF